ncbi:hypothetical protein MKL29_08625 [Streptococcus suis]|nr:hypothetical protein [Streptococcus suis]
MRITLDEYLEAIEEIGDVDDLLVRAVSLIPNRYFYKVHLMTRDCQLMKEELSSLYRKRQSLAYRNDRHLKRLFKLKQRAYSDYLEACAWQDKSDLILEYLYLDQETKLAFLDDIITEYRLFKHLIGDLEDYMRKQRFCMTQNSVDLPF